jgi:hypothetical protein
MGKNQRKFTVIEVRNLLTHQTHSDLKPGNIVVEGDAESRMLCVLKEIYPNFSIDKHSDPRQFIRIEFAKALSTHSSHAANHISRPPGSFLVALADFFCSKKTQNEITNQIIADMQFEYNEALFAGKKRRAAWIHLRGCCSFLMALGVYRMFRLAAGLFFRSTTR